MPNLILVAHGSSYPSSTQQVIRLAHRASEELHQDIHVAFLGISHPSLASYLADHSQPAIIVPLLLSQGYHSCTDLPHQILTSTHPDVTISPAFTPCTALSTILTDQLLQAGWTHGDPVILAGTGSSYTQAQADLVHAGQLLEQHIHTPVTIAVLGGGQPRYHDIIAHMKSQGHSVNIASYLLTDGFFHQRLLTSDADIISQPLADHPRMAHLIAQRFLHTQNAATQTLHDLP